MTTLTELQLNRQLYKTQPQTLETLPADDVASNLSPAPSTAIASGNSVTDVNTNAETINGASITPGTIPPSTLDIANFGWTQTCVFSVTDADTIAWGSGTFTSANGDSIYSIGAGNTGNMGAAPTRTYVYLDINVSTTAYQMSTTITDPIGIGKVLIAVCQKAVAPSTTATYILVQTTQIVGDNVIANTINAEKLTVAQLSAITADLGSITAGTIIVVSGGNTVAITPGSTNAIISGPTGTPTFTLTSAGQLTTVGLTSLNMKSYTDFETITRFITVGGDILPVFGNQGCTLSPSAVATHWSQMLWWITQYVFNNNPSFTCSMLCLSGFSAGDGVGFIGLGNPPITGSGFTETGTNYCGFELKKSGSVTTIIAVQCDGGGTVAFSGTLQTLVDNDSLELYIKMTSTGVNYYTRLNGGTISTVTTLTTHMPTGAETYIKFASSNKGSSNNFQVQLQCAAYEH